jgi:predicted nucleic acid-binding protein
LTDRWVLDCSFAAALVLPDKSSSRVHTFFQKQIASELWVPGLWWYELANVLAMAERKGVLSRPDVEDAISLYGHLTFKTDNTDTMEHVRKLDDICRTYGLTAYDAAYLELAFRRKASLASLDRQLLEAAKKSGVETW